MKIKLLAHTPEAKRVAFTAIRNCYSKEDIEHIYEDGWKDYNDRGDTDRLIKHIVNHGHTSTLEHIQFTFSIESVSRALLAQLTRHRIGFAYSVKSQRYVRETDTSDFYIPNDVDKSSAARYHYVQAIKEAKKAYNTLLKLGIKPEDARGVLPNAQHTRIVMSVNLRALLDIYNKRTTPGAQAEIKQLVKELMAEVVHAEPWIRGLL